MTVPKFPLGAYLYNPSATDPGSEAWFNNQLATFTDQMGAAPQFMDTFTDYYANWDQWVPIQNQLIQGWSATPALANTIPVMTIPMACNADFGNSDQVFKDIVAGKHDDVFQGLINGWKNAGYTTVYARIGPEMNGNFEPWYMGSDPGTQADFVAAFQHIANLVHSMSGITVKTVWNPADSNYTAQPTINAYPGDQYVDVIGSDIYSAVYPVQLYDWAKNDGTVDATIQQWLANPINLEHYWSNPNATQWNPNGYDPGQWGFAQTLALAKAHNKPIGLAETGAGGDGTSNGPVDDPDFVKWLYNQLSAPGAPTVDFVNIWDINPSDGNWQFTDGTKPLELAAWQQYFGNPANVTAGPSVPLPPTIGSGADTLVLSISEDAYQGDAQFTVSVDGVQQGGTLTAQGIRGLSQSQNFTFLGNWPGNGRHSVVVTFLNDAYGGSVTQDRNLYINSLAYDGSVQSLNVEQGGNGSQTFGFGAGATTATFLDQNSARYGTSITPGISTTYSASATGLNNNIYEWTQGNVTAIGAASFNMILVGTITDGSGGSFLLNNFNEADATLSNGPTAAGASSTLEIDHAMHGTIVLSSGNYATTINALSAYAGQIYNTFGVTMGSGNDQLTVNGDSGRTYAIVTAGSGTDTITLSNVLNGSVTGGSGAATANLGGSVGTAIAGSGSLDVTGGAPGDTYVYHAASGLLTVENFQPGKGDLLEVDVSLQAALTETTTAAGLMLSFGTAGHGVLLKGVTSLAATQLAWLAADGSVTAPTAPTTPTPPTPPTLPVPPTVGSGADTLTLSMSEDAYQGDAQFTVSVDGVQQGGTFTAQGSHSAGQSQNFSFLGNWSLDRQHSVVVNFTNDLWGGTAATDRNLYVNTLTVDGGTPQTLNAEQAPGGPATYTFGTAAAPVVPVTPTVPVPPTVGSGPNRLVLAMAEDAYLGDAQFTVSVDGVQQGGTYTTQASHAAGQSQNFTFLGNWSPSSQHTVVVNFVNDRWDGSASQDRNLYVNAIAIDSTTQSLGVEQAAGGPKSYSFGTVSSSLALVDNAGKSFSSAITPGATTTFGTWTTGLNNNVYQWIQGSNVTGIGAASFNMVQSATLTDASGASFVMNNFDESDATVSGGPTTAGSASTLEIDNAMRGTIGIGAGNYNTVVNVLSAYAGAAGNSFNIDLGSGSDTLTLNGDPQRTSAIVHAGSGASTMNFIGVQNVAVTGGAGSASVHLGNGVGSATAGAGSMDVTGGTAADSYLYHAGGGLLTIENFSQAKGDVLQVDRALQSAMTQSSTANGVLLSFGSAGSGVLLHGVSSLPSSQVSFV